jgi:uncharacterized protein (DUF362 family)
MDVRWITVVKVAVVRGENPGEMVDEAIRLLGGLEGIVAGGDALIKPNMGAWISRIVPVHVNRWATTKPEIVAALIRELKEAGVADIAVGDGAFLDQDTMEQFEESGMKAAVEAAGGTVIDLDKGNHVRVEAPNGFAYEISEPVLNTGNLIDVPVMKTHIQTKLTLGIKNLKGVVSKNTKRMMHRGDLHGTIAHLLGLVEPRLTVVDGTLGMEGLGPSVFGRPKRPGLIVAGTDTVAVDTVTATIMGHDPSTVDHIRIAGELGIGETDLTKIEVLGAALEEVMYPFEPARLGAQSLVESLGFDGVRYHGWTPGLSGSECTGCIDTFMNALVALRDDVPGVQKPLDVVIGSRDVPEGVGDNVLCYGNCQAKNRDKGTWLKGCPPELKPTYMTLARMTQTTPSFILASIKRLIKGEKVKPLNEWAQKETANI